MRDEFSTFDIQKAFKSLSRDRLREWIDRDYFKLKQSADGRGTKAIFSRKDIYAVRFFEKLLARGFRRDYAAKFVDLFQREYFKDVRAIAFFEGIKKDGEVVPQAISYGVDDKVFAIDLDTGKTPGKAISFWDMVDCEWDDVYVFNLKRLKEETDVALAKLE